MRASNCSASPTRAKRWRARSAMCCATASNVLPMTHQTGAPVTPRDERGGDVRQPCRLNVLVVEDDVLIRTSMADMLDALGHEVAEAGDATEALAAIDTREFDTNNFFCDQLENENF